jgi:hypothetical protein
MLSKLLLYLTYALCAIGILVCWIPSGLVLFRFEIAAFSLALLWLAGWAAGQLESRFTFAFVPFVGVLAIGALQLKFGWSVYSFVTETELLRWGAYLCIFILAFQLSGDWRDASSFRTIFLTFASIVALVSVLQWYAGNGKIFWLFETKDKAGMGPFVNYDHFASFVSLALPIALYQMLHSQTRRWLYALVAAMLYASVVASGSRAGFVLNTAEILLMVILVKIPSRIVFTQLALSLVLGSIAGWGYLFDRFQQEDPYAGRREIALSTVEMVKANPWHGYGLGTWTEVYPAFATKDLGVFINATHNDWLQWASDGGLPMAGAMAILLISAASALKKVPWSLGVPIVFIHGLIDFPMATRFSPPLVFLMLGIALRSAALLREERG